MAWPQKNGYRADKYVPRHKRMTAADRARKLREQQKRRCSSPTFGSKVRQALEQQGLDCYTIYKELRVQQNGRCAICGKPEGKRRLALDHCHRTGKVRGLLCYSCNTKLGFVEKYLKQIVRYLRKGV